MTEPDRTALPWVDVWPVGARERSKLPPGPPLWARAHEGRIFEVVVGVGQGPGTDGDVAAMLAKFGWFEAVDEQGRSR